MFKANKVDNEYNEIREIIIDNNKKLRSITFNKCIITNDIFYYNDRL